MSDIQDYGVILWSVIRQVCKALWLFALIPIFTLGMMFALPVLCIVVFARLAAILLMTQHKPARTVLMKTLRGENDADTDGDYSNLEVGFNVDLERDLVGASQVRRERSVANRLL